MYFVVAYFLSHGSQKLRYQGAHSTTSCEKINKKEIKLGIHN